MVKTKVDDPNVSLSCSSTNYQNLNVLIGETGTGTGKLLSQVEILNLNSPHENHI